MAKSTRKTKPSHSTTSWFGKVVNNSRIKDLLNNPRFIILMTFIGMFANLTQCSGISLGDLLTPTITVTSTLTLTPIPTVPVTPTPTLTPSPIINAKISTTGLDKNTFIVKGNEVSQYKKGDYLVVYSDIANDTMIAIGLLKVINNNADSVTTQAILVHPKSDIRADLQVDRKINQLSTSELIPAFESAIGYLLENESVRIVPQAKIEVGSILEAIEPRIVDGKIVDTLPMSPTVRMRVTSIGDNKAIVVAELIDGSWPEAGTLVKLLPQATPIPTPTPNPQMNGVYNIAVADFYVDDQAILGINTQPFAQGMVQVLQEQTTNTNDILIWGPDQIGKVKPQNIEKRAEEINADLFISGTVSKNGFCKIELEFYVSPGKLSDAEKLSGPYPLHSIHVDSCEYDSAYRKNLEAETSGLLLIIDTLINHYQSGEYEEMLTFLRAAEAQITPRDKTRIGYILYLFMGNAAGKLKQYNVAEEYYKQSLELQPDFPRALIGLAGIYYMRGLPAQDEQPPNLLSIEQAIDLYRRILDQTVQSEDQISQAKVHFGLGQALFVHSYVTHAPFDEAKLEFTRVITIYNDSAKASLRERAGEAYAYIGMIDCQNGLEQQALESYKQAVDHLNPSDRRNDFESKVLNRQCNFERKQ